MNSSFWISSSEKTDYPKLNEDLDVDVCIIGGGITSAITAYLLSNSGLKICILEKDRVCLGVSAYSTSKITSQHGLFYTYLKDSFGVKFAKKYLDSNEEAVMLIKEIIKKEKIECDFENENAYVYATSEIEAKKVEEEIKVVNDLGMKAEYIKSADLPLKDMISAIKFKNQGQFNARKYTLKLFDICYSKGIKIYERSKVIGVHKKSFGYTVNSECGSVNAKFVVIATHYPIKNFPGCYFLKMYQSKSYAILVDPNDKLFTGMYIGSSTKAISFRSVKCNNKRMLLVVGSDHKTGVVDNDINKSYTDLEDYVRNIYPRMEVKYRWSTEDCVSIDKIPYIGKFSKFYTNMFVATGFKKWGITLSHVAGKILSDKILGVENDYSYIYNATRFGAIKNIKEVINMVKQTTYSLVLKKSKSLVKSVDDIENESGGIVRHNGKKIGVYKDKDGKIYAVRPICKHLGCILEFNNLDKTWDCPCHGSRYDYTGKIITEPTYKDLDIVNIENYL